MRFMIIGMAKEAKAGPPPTAEEFAAMQRYNAAAVESGMLLAAEGLAPTAKGARVTFSGDERLVVDGPFTESKEVIAGFTIIRASSLAEAIDWVKRAPNAAGNGEATVEIRKLMDVEDFGEGFTASEELAKVKFE